MNIYDTRTLAQVISVQPSLTTFWLDYFPTELTFDTMDIQFDMVPNQRRLAPFVAPNVAGRIMRDKGYTAKTFRPAYVKPKHTIDPSRAIPRTPGEAIGGSLSLDQRMNAILVKNLADQKQMIQRRWEWMACKAVVDSAVTVVGDDYPSVTVNFGRDASLSSTLLTTARWSQTTSDPLGDIGDMRKKVFDLASAGVTRLVFGLDAWDLFSQHAKVTPLLNSLTRGSNTTFNIAIAEGTPFEYRGQISGQNGIGVLDMYTYSETYEDDNGTAQPFMDTDAVVGLGAGLQGVRCFGAIMDIDAGLVATPMFSKQWSEKDPSAWYVLTQSAPLMVPAQPNGSFTLHVNG
jgi:Phage major capsid protein E